MLRPRSFTLQGLAIRVIPAPSHTLCISPWTLVRLAVDSLNSRRSMPCMVELDLVWTHSRGHFCELFWFRPSSTSDLRRGSGQICQIPVRILPCTVTHGWERMRSFLMYNFSLAHPPTAGPAGQRWIRRSYLLSSKVLIRRQ